MQSRVRENGMATRKGASVDPFAVLVQTQNQSCHAALDGNQLHTTKASLAHL